MTIPAEVGSFSPVVPVESASPPAIVRPATVEPVRLSVLFPYLTDTTDFDPAVRGITLDSRLVGPGDLYVALPGRAHHGAAFATGAREAGAVAVLTDPAGAGLAAASGLPVVVVDDPRLVMAAAAAAIYGRPSAAMTMYAITGTNGKTTTTYLLDAALRASGQHSGTIGTIGFQLDGQNLDVVRTTVTTPESPELQALLAVFAERGADSVVMEVSSHALTLGRADAIMFDVAAFTNFGRDHLDFHGDEESYFEAKASLFTSLRTRRAVINIDDPRGRQLVDRVRAAGDLGLCTISLDDATADCYATAVEVTADGRTRVQAVVNGRSLPFTVGLPGDFNVRNALTALAMIDLLAGVRPVGVGPAVVGQDGDVERAAEGLATAAVPGRMQRVDLPSAVGVGAPQVVVDFAHTPQAVSAALGALAGRRRIVVLGCGGDRDAAKRGPMGAAAAREASVVVVTDDNPRSERPEEIRAAVITGAQQARDAEDLNVLVLDGGDRRSAIGQALALAGPGDVVAVLGRGHETRQQIGDSFHPFDDAAVIAELWSALLSTTPTDEEPGR